MDNYDCQIVVDDDNGADGFLTKTDKCDKFRFREWAADMAACEAEAAHELKTILAHRRFSKDHLRRGVCQHVSGMVSMV